MQNVNLLVLAGRLVRDPELNYVSDGTAVANFSIAVNRRFLKPGAEDYEESLDGFFDCELYGLEAQTMCDTVGKGAEVQLVGSIRQVKYETKGSNPRTVSKVVVRATSVGRVFLAPRSDAAQDEAERAVPQPA